MAVDFENSDILTIARYLSEQGFYYSPQWEQAADEIERLREAIRQADYVFELLAPANHSQTTDAEMYSLLSSVGEKLSDMIAEWENAALGENK